MSERCSKGLKQRWRVSRLARLAFSCNSKFLLQQRPKVFRIIPQKDIHNFYSSVVSRLGSWGLSAEKASNCYLMIRSAWSISTIRVVITHVRGAAVQNVFQPVASGSRSLGSVLFEIPNDCALLALSRASYRHSWTLAEHKLG